MGKFVRWDLIDGRLSWSFDQDKIAAEKLFDGCYIVSGELPKEKMAASEVVASYKKLGLVEEAFRSLKTVHLKYGPSTTRPMIESEVTSSCARWPTTCSGISSSGLNLYSPPTAPTKIDNGQCATSLSAWWRSVATRSRWALWSSRKSPRLNPTSKQFSTISKCVCSHIPEI